MNHCVLQKYYNFHTNQSLEVKEVNKNPSAFLVNVRAPIRVKI